MSRVLIVVAVALVGGGAMLVGGPTASAGYFIVGIVALLTGGNWLVDGAVAVSRHIGLSTLLIGLTVVAFGTSAPELVFNVIAAAGGHGQLSFGNIVGSNIANIGLVLGLAAVVRPLTVHGRLITTELPWLVVVSALMLAIAALPPKIDLQGEAFPGFTRISGALLLAMFVLMSWQWYVLGRREHKSPLVREAEKEIETVPTSLGPAIIKLIAGIVLLAIGGKLAELGAVGIATYLGLSQALIGLTIVALATSLPEVATTIAACLRGHPDLAVGNIVGSNLFNILLVMGVTPFFGAVPVSTPWGWIDMGVMLSLTVILAIMIVPGRHRIDHWEGWALLAVYFSYMTYVVLRELA
jgi:cation:H+ antiporter